MPNAARDAHWAVCDCEAAHRPGLHATSWRTGGSAPLAWERRLLCGFPGARSRLRNPRVGCGITRGDTPVDPCPARTIPGLPLARLVPLVFVIACAVLALWLYPFDCDAAFAVHDGIWYGIDAETKPSGSINPHHPLFHVLLLACVKPLRELGISGPGHVAARIVAGVGGILVILQIIALAGRKRVLVGCAFALVLLSSRGFLVELASGENVLPATAAALFALRVAARPNSSILATASALTLALLLRQDNLFSIPAVAAAFAFGRQKGSRAGPVFGMLLIAGIITVAGYAIAWWVNCGGNERPFAWLTRFGRDGPWTGPKHFTLERMPVYASTFAVAMTGRLWPIPDHSALRGLAYVAAILIPALFLRGNNPNVRLGVPIVITLAGRALFHSWYEADNYEWLVLPAALIVAFGSGLARGEPATPVVARGVGASMLVVLSIFVIGSHGLDTWKLRERVLMSAIEEAADVDQPHWRFLVDGARVGVGLRILGIPYEDLSPRGTESENMLSRLQRELAIKPVPTIVIADRFVMDGMPHTARNQWPWAVDHIDLPGWEILRRGGRAFAARWRPPRPETESSSRPETR